jgi:hypothetical protein
MKIIITESQLKLIKEAVGVPENILDEGKVLYDIVKSKLKEINSNKEKYLFEDIEIDLRVSDVNFTNLNLLIKVEELEEYDGTEAVIASMGVGNEFNFDEGIMMQINAETSTIDLFIQFIVPEGWQPSDLYNSFIQYETQNISTMAHELMHRFKRSKKTKGLAGDTADYQTYSSGRLNFGIPVINEFMRYSYFIQNEENVVRPTEVASRMTQKGITRENFYEFLMNDDVIKELKKIQNFSFEYLIQSLYDQMDRVFALLEHAGENPKENSPKENIKMVLELVYINLSNTKMEFFEKYILSHEETMFSKMGPFSQLFGGKAPSESKTKLLNKYRNHVTKYENREMDFFKDECERFNYVATKLIKRISKVYSLIPDEKGQTNESILDWELHQKLMEKRYGKRPIQTSYNYITESDKKKLDNSIYDKIEVKKSKIAGKGLFAKEDIKKNTTYLYAIIEGGSYFGGEPLRYLNHSYNPNIKNTRIGNKIYGKTIKNIKKGDELTSNYDDNDYTLSYEEMLKVNYDDILDVKKIKSNIPFFKYRITPK